MISILSYGHGESCGEIIFCKSVVYDIFIIANCCLDIFSRILSVPAIGILGIGSFRR